MTTNTTQIALADAKLKNLIIYQSNIKIPATATIINATFVSKYDDTGDVIKDTVDKIKLECIDTQLAKLLLQANQSLQQLKGFTLELVGSESVLKQINKDNLINKDVNLINPKLALQWVSRKTGGSYAALKVIIDISDFINKNHKNEV